MPSKGNRILIIDDEPQIYRLLRVALGAHGYHLAEAMNDADGINLAATFKPDLIIIDLGLPDKDDKEVVRQIRDWSDTPIIILSARDREQEKIDALDLGADDYILKPFSIGELMARIRVALRHSAHTEHEPIIRCGDLVIDIAQRHVTVRDVEIKLTPTEYDLLKLLAQHAGKVLTHKQLLTSVWGNSYDSDSHYIRVYIGQLRRKIEENPTRPRYIITESGVGYRLMGQ